MKSVRTMLAVLALVTMVIKVFIEWQSHRHVQSASE